MCLVAQKQGPRKRWPPVCPVAGLTLPVSPSVPTESGAAPGLDARTAAAAGVAVPSLPGPSLRPSGPAGADRLTCASPMGSTRRAAAPCDATLPRALAEPGIHFGRQDAVVGGGFATAFAAAPAQSLAGFCRRMQGPAHVVGSYSEAGRLPVRLGLSARQRSGVVLSVPPPRTLAGPAPAHLATGRIVPAAGAGALRRVHGGGGPCGLSTHRFSRSPEGLGCRAVAGVADPAFRRGPGKPFPALRSR
jgi:hypothetical protein